MSDTADGSIGILDVKAALEDAFKGCDVVCPSSQGGHHAEVKFDEYEIRVILSGRRAPNRPIHFRFMQRIVTKVGRRPTKVLLNEVRTTDPKVLAIAIRDAKEYLLGIVQAIQKALKPRPTMRTTAVDDLFFGDD